MFGPALFEYLEGDATVFEQSPIEGLTRDGKLMAYEHASDWQCMDTIRDRDVLHAACESNDAPWLRSR